MDIRFFYTLGNFGAVLFFALMAISAMQNWKQSNSLISLGILVVNGLIVAVYLLPRPVDAITRNPSAWIIGIVATIAGISYRPNSEFFVPALSNIGNIMQIVGLTAVIGALLSLRDSFGVVAANRGIKQDGFYRFVRHPLYSAELFFFCGYVFSNQSLINVMILIALIAAQYSRSRIEENFLAQDPAYMLYLAKTRYRFIPGVV